ncbi:MAG TPA: formylmethanofuran dehydrogenase subunit B [Burkholderiales bacterium]|nr:formylmethanofuran dehydrogenase subunit B [Burkholderiales bacterium]
MTQLLSPGIWDEVPCPFCGLACDDLRVASQSGKLEVIANGCSISSKAFAGLSSSKPDAPRIAGKTALQKDAVAAVAEILRKAKQPLIAGLGTDVAGMRALMQIADRVGAVVDHMNSAYFMSNILTLQDSGWIVTTLSELKNRVDLLVIAGTDVTSRFPRFFERYVWNRDALFRDSLREVVYFGRGLDTRAGTAPDGRKPTVIACDTRRIGEIAGAVRCLIAGRPLQARQIAGVPLMELQKLATRMQSARYGVLAWVAADFHFKHAELTVQSLCELVRDLNRSTRFSGLPLGGNEGDMTANQVCSWQSGFPLRTSFGNGGPSYDPHYFSADRMLRESEADALLWVSSFNEKNVPPETSIPVAVLARSGMNFSKEPQVHIPVATPGVDHSGHVYRTDNVVALPLRKLRESALPSVAQVAEEIEKAL